jgi:hypothetical protein
MAEIMIKSPQMKDRELGTYKLCAKVSVGASAPSEIIDVDGLTVANTAATTFTLSGFEAASDLSLDAGRDAGLVIASIGTSGTVPVDTQVVSGVVSGTAGSRIITYTLKGTTLALNATDDFEAAQFEFVLPIKSKDF